MNSYEVVVFALDFSTRNGLNNFNFERNKL